MTEQLLGRVSDLHPDLAPLVGAYYQHTSADDLAARDPRDLIAVVESHRDLAATRPPGRPSVRIARAGPGVDTGADPRTVVEIVCEDMPFLVDSVSAELVRQGLAVQRLLHPIIPVQRDVSGSLLAAPAPPDADDAVAESWMHIEIERLADDAGVRHLEQRLLAVLTDVREVVEDTGRMTSTMLDVAAELDSADLPQTGEAAELLRWLTEGHFVLLGYRRYTLDRSWPGPSLKAVLSSGLGVLRRDSVGTRNFTPGPEADRVLAPDRLVLTRASAPATVHRGVYPYIIGVKTVDGNGRIDGEHRFIGVLTTSALHEDVLDIPVLRQRVRAVLDRAGAALDSYSGQRILELAQTYPRAELFSTDEDALYDVLVGVLDLAERRALRLFCRRDPYGRFYSCLVYLPRDRYTTTSRLAMQDVLVEGLEGSGTEYSASIGESQLARVHFVVWTPDGAPTDPDVPALTASLADAVQTWEDRLAEAARVAPSDTGDLDPALLEHYAAELPTTYKADFDAAAALDDIVRIEALEPENGLSLRFHQLPDSDVADWRLALYLTGEPVTLTQLLPILQKMGLEVLDERPYRIQRRDERSCWLYDLGVRLGPDLLGVAAATDEVDQRAGQQRFEDAFVAAWRGESEVDGFNRLVLRAGLDWHQVAVLRAYVRYQRQIGIPYSQEYAETVLTEHWAVGVALVELFETRFDPSYNGPDRESAQEDLVKQITAKIDDVSGLDADRILRNLLTLIGATVRTNYFCSTTALAIKLEPRRVPDLPEPRPAFEVFVCSPRVEGVHLRMGPVARGGLRWSDRREDFRTEILGLMKAQAVKNAPIVPVGAKGGFVVKRPPNPTGDAAADREANLAEGVACYRIFVSSLLELTDNLVDGETVPAQDVVRHDADDSYLVVAADKGTATFSDIANEVAVEHGFWLDDAFASGGSSGFDHKAMGITARGAWESVKRHFQELDVDVARDPFTVVGIGDMSGDVFGNGMLLSDKIRLVAAFDHRHVFVDPDPDPATSFEERQRLFGLSRSSWDDYDRDLISKGGGVWARSAKRIELSAELRNALGVDESTTHLTPAELIRTVLLAPADLLWVGGIGTYVKASTESHGDIGDKANDAVRVDGHQLRAKVVGEGGNLGFSQLGRVEFADTGGKINTDAIDNSAGVDCSDHEVNIKVLLARLMADGEIDRAGRDEMLTEMTDEVADLVLADNIAQNTLLGVSRAHGSAMLPAHDRLVSELEQHGELDRALEYLPGPAEFESMAAEGRSLRSPELAVLAAHVKLALKHELLAGDLPDGEAFVGRLPSYFPVTLQERFPQAIREHPLRREIVTSLVVNEVVDNGGSTFAFRLAEEMSVSASDAVRAYAVATAVFGLPEALAEIDALAGSVSVAVLDGLRLELRRLLDRSCRWLLINRPQPLAVGAEITRFAGPIDALAGQVRGWMRGFEKRDVTRDVRRLVEAGVPEPLAVRVTTGLARFGLFDVVDVAELAELHLAVGEDIDRAMVAELYYALSSHLEVNRLLSAVSALERGDRWHSLARLAVRDDLYTSLRAITLDVLRGQEPGDSVDTAISRWEKDNVSRIDRARPALTELAGAGELDLAKLSVAARRVRGMVR